MIIDIVDYKDERIKVDNVDTGETGVEVIGNIYENPELIESVEQ